MGELFRRIRHWIRQRSADAELAEELRFHRDMIGRAVEAEGAPPNDAVHEARRALGSTALAHDQAHDVWVPFWLQGFGRDLRLAVRTLRATPIVSIVAMVSLALGIGANTAIFSLIDSLMLQSLPVHEPSRLVRLTDSTPPGHPFWNYPVWREIRRRPRLFDGSLSWAETRFNMSAAGTTDYVNGLWVSGSYFDVLGVPPLLGRTLSEADDEPGLKTGPVAVISYGFWQHHFGGTRDIVGRALTVDGVACTIVGVTPRGFLGADIGHRFDVAVPLNDKPLMEAVGATRQTDTPQTVDAEVTIMARLRADQTIETATAALRGVQPQIRQATLPSGFPKPFLEQYLRSPFQLRSAATGVSMLRTRFARPLLAILVIVALVLLVACANLANLALARAAARRRELGVRLALGASRWSLVRQLTAESLLLAGIGSAGGLIVAAWTARLLADQLSTAVAYNGPQMTGGQIDLTIALDGRVLAFTAALMVFTTVIVGLLPALRASRVAPLESLTDRARSTSWRRRTGPAGMAIVAQMALSVVAVVAAGLFVRTIHALETRPLGFDPRGLLVMKIDAGHTTIPASRRLALYADALNAVRRVPGVAAAALSTAPPISNGPRLGQPIRAISGEAPLPPRGVFSQLNVISPGWFTTMGVRLLDGRDVRVTDRLDAPPVAIVNETFARAYMHGADPVGHTLALWLPGSPPPVEIVGMVSDAVYGTVRTPLLPTVYLPVAQRDKIWWPFLASMDVDIRSTDGRPERLAKNLAQAVNAVNPDLAMSFRPLTDDISDTLVQEQLLAKLSGAFAVLALLLAALGLYGVVAYAVSRRRSEIGIRMALGAAPASVVRLVLSRVALLAIGGLALGVGACTWLSGFVAALLYGVQPHDPATLVGSAAVLVAVVLLAGWLPARRAAWIDPADVLRCE